MPKNKGFNKVKNSFRSRKIRNNRAEVRASQALLKPVGNHQKLGKTINHSTNYRYANYLSKKESLKRNITHKPKP